MEDTNTEIEKRKENFIKNIKENKNIISYLVLAGIILFGFYIRTRNIPLLRDITTGKYIPGPEADTFVFLRYAQYILEHGSLMVHDMMRYMPLGLDTKDEATLISYVIVYLYKFLHIFNSNITLEYVDVIYPAIFFGISLIFFFLLVRKLFNDKVALVASFLLTIVPGYLQRTISGFADKEAFGMALMFATFYFYICFMESTSIKKVITYSLLAVFTTVLLALSWGGSSFAFAIIGGFTLFEMLRGNLKEKNKIFGYWIYIGLFTIILITISPARYNITSLVTSLTSFSLYLVLLVTIIYFLIENYNILNLKTKFENKIPMNIFSFCISIVMGFLAALLFWPRALSNEFNTLITMLTKPFGVSRWILTVAESHQPFFNPEWISQMNLWYILIFVAGSVFLFYILIKDLKDYFKLLMATYVLLILALMLSRYSSSSIFNGSSSISIVFYLGSILLFIGTLIYIYMDSFYKNKNIFSKIPELNLRYIFILIWLFFMLIAARSAIRLIFVLIPIATILSSYAIVESINYFYKKTENKNLIWISILILILIAYLIVIPFTKSTLMQAKYTGPMYNQQWQYAGAWVRNNTVEGSVFAHWWDYGYLVQTGFERATITDGGNFIYAWNHWMGRNVLTGHSEQEALDFLYPHNATHLLIVSDEIGKYPAYSSIGADENYDRYAWITTFNLDQKQIQETRDNIVYVYTGGGTVLDDDFNYNGILFPKQIAGIAGFLLPISKNGTEIFSQPTAIMIYNNKRYDVPVNCVYANKVEYEFKNQTGLDVCLVLIPSINQQNQVNPFGSLIYVSPRVKKTNFARLYLFDEQSDYFKLVYNDEGSMPLAILEGRGLIGPLKIWKISYPKDIQYNETYIGLELPNPRVMEV